MAKKKKKRKKNRLGLFILIIVISIIIIMYNETVGKVNLVDISKNEEELLVNQEIDDKSADITNIVLFGIDTRGEIKGERSDTIIIASIDKEHNKIKLSSIMRDTYVNIPGKGYDKINHSYMFGGPELTIKTINQNFDMNIKDFVTVDFFALEKIIDSIGGVEINVKSSERNTLNGLIMSLDNLDKTTTPKVRRSGLQTLSGRQAVAYCRIRYVGNSDFERTDRQRRVLEQIANKVLNDMSLTQCLGLVENLLPYIETSLSPTDIAALGTSVLSSGITTMEDTRVPVSDHAKDKTIKGTYYLVPNTLNDNVKYLHKFIYEEEYTPSDKVLEISKVIQKK